MEKPNHPINDEQIEQGRRAVAQLGAEMQRAAKAFAEAFAPVITKHMQALRPFIEWANSPKGKAAITVYFAESGIRRTGE